MYGFEDFGIDGRRAPLIKVEDLAAHYIQELLAFKKEGPYYLAGFCFGGAVAYEMAKQLTEQGKDVSLLALIDSTSHAQGLDNEADVSNSRLQQCSIKLAEEIVILESEYR